jgi:multidrug resistance efflux pump
MHRLANARMLGVGAVIVAIVALGIWYERFRHSDDSAVVAGVVRATEIHVAPEISGRLARVLVLPGQSVQRGEPLALLGNPELWAAVAEARAQADKAAAERDRVYAGVRQEEVETLRREIFKAQAVLVYARQEVDRKSVLAARSDVSQQDLDEARAEAAHAAADVAVAEASYAEAQLGPTSEERALADAQVKAAEAARDVVEARAAKTLLRAPAPGVVGLVVPEIGEAIVPGEPVLTVVPDGGQWFGFNLREDALGSLAIGSRVSVETPGSSTPASGTLTEMRDWGEFATWQAARASGDHDLHTFFLRLDPVAPMPRLGVGQTVWLHAAR